MQRCVRTHRWTATDKVGEKQSTGNFLKQICGPLSFDACTTRFAGRTATHDVCQKRSLRHFLQQSKRGLPLHALLTGRDCCIAAD